MRICFMYTMILMTAVTSAHAGVVQTVAGRFEGKLVFQNDHLLAGDKKLSWDDVLFVLMDSETRPAVRSQRVHLKNGESWAADIDGMADNKLDVRSDIFGKKQVELRLVARLDLAATLQHENRKLGVLYRTKGEPVPGKLLGITADKIKIDSAVGELDLPRDSALHYGFAAQKSIRSAGEDDVTLLDGGRYRGKLRAGADAIELEHAILGKLTLPASIVRSVARSSSRVLDLVDAKPATVRSTPLAPTRKNEVEEPRIVEPVGCVRGLRLDPNLSVEYPLFAAAGRKGRLRTILMPVANAVGDVRVRVKVGAKVVLEREVTPKSRPEELVFAVAAGDTLELVVDFGANLRFPCGVVLGDPHVVWE